MGRVKEPGATVETGAIDVDHLAPSLKAESAPAVPPVDLPASPAPDVPPADLPAGPAPDVPPVAFPTAPRAMTPDGFELDEWGLPRVGPVRVALLAQLDRADPNIDPTGWERVSAPAATQE